MMAIVTYLRSLDKGTFKFIFWLTFTLNLFFVFAMYTSVPRTRTPLCYDRQRCNGTELNGTLSETKSESHVYHRFSPKFWVFITFFGALMNITWICCHMVLSLELYQANVSRRCVLNVTTITHLLFMLAVWVVSVVRHPNSPTFDFSLMCLSVFMMITIVINLLYVQSRPEFASCDQEEVEQLKYSNFDTKRQNVTV